MSLNIRIALDAMGGDDAPDIVVSGASMARKRHPNLELIFIGDDQKIKPLIKKYKNLSDAKIIHTDDMVAPDARPAQALRHGKKTSMWLAVNEVAIDNADADDGNPLDNNDSRHWLKVLVRDAGRGEGPA